MSQELTTKESIRLGQSMNIVGASFNASHDIVDFTDLNIQKSFRTEVLALYSLLSDIEDEVKMNKELAVMNEKVIAAAEAIQETKGDLAKSKLTPFS